MTQHALMFQVYNKMEREDFVKMVKGFPFMLILQIKQVSMFCGQFKKYRFNNYQIVKLVTESGGIMGCKVSNFVGLFDNLK